MVQSEEALWKRVREISAATNVLMRLASVASDRLSLTQAAFFLAAAKGDAMGRAETRSSLMAAHPELFKGSVRNSYRQLLEASRVYPKALGWLTTHENPLDSREQFLRLTSLGKSVIEGCLEALDRP